MQQLGERGVRKNVRETALQTLRSVKKKGEEVLQMLELRFPYSPWRRSWRSSLSPCNTKKTMSEQIPTLQPMEDPMTEQVGMPWQKLQPMESPCRSRLQSGAVACREEPTQEQPVPEGLHPMERTHAGAVCEGLSPMGGTPRWSRGRVWRGRSSREDLVRADHSPCSSSTCAAWQGGGRKVGNEGVKLSLGCREGWGEGGFSFVLDFPTLFLTGNRLNQFFPSWVCFARDSSRWVIALSLSWPVCLCFSVLSSLPALRRGNDGAVGWGSGSQPWPAQHTHCQQVTAPCVPLEATSVFQTPSCALWVLQNNCQHGFIQEYAAIRDTKQAGGWKVLFDGLWISTFLERKRKIRVLFVICSTSVTLLLI